MRKTRDRVIAFVAGILFGPAIVFAGLETGSYISDLVATNPLSSDLASTGDDHIRLLKSTIKASFPNINGAMTATDEELSLLAGKTGTVWTSANDGSGSTLDADLLDGVSLAGLGANPSVSIGLSATNGSATTYLRSDGAPALSQAIAPTWTDKHIFSKAAASAGDAAVVLSSSAPRLSFIQSDGAANNKLWTLTASAEQLSYAIENDANNAESKYMTVDRTGTTVDRVAFPATARLAHLIGTAFATPSSGAQLLQVSSGSATSAAAFKNNSSTEPTIFVGSDQTGGNVYVQFYDGNDPDSATGLISTNGTTTTYGTTSDVRLKKNFAKSPSARKVIDCINVESYDWKENGQHVDHGFVAQRLNKCAPYAVTQGKVWNVDPSKLVPALIKYVQEQDDRIERLEAQIRRRH